ncbi:protein of unknown function DUF378 [Methanosalsum zhilinae DSM 4017]|uniref:DUF378 domain-containing protein n=1 Tax=Methanosalsum zhilinae (strain DSM 4017 / NBRC 107636 / OCM 62 / WeN5) TaxID=679901 RepID=F7XQI0_METZD|nr:DUF378 domain-containing protein [Methanosalsum zhilinae]AEH60481.1 protein of unknown function DUF378 [Methanosalsum zhilinae DSM 4017]
MEGKSTVDLIFLALLIIGGLNWGLVGVFNFNLVEALFGAWPVVERAVYTIVGIAALYTIYYITRK